MPQQEITGAALTWELAGAPLVAGLSVETAAQFSDEDWAHLGLRADMAERLKAEVQRVWRYVDSNYKFERIFSNF